MVNAALDVEHAGETGGGVAVLDAQLAPRAIAIGIHRSLGHAEFAGDLLRRKMLVDKPQAFPLTRCQQSYLIFDNGVTHWHSQSS